MCVYICTYTAIDRLSVIWKSDLTDEMKQFFPTSSCIDTVVWMRYMDANLTYREKAWRQLHKNAASNVKQVLGAAPHKAASVRPLTTRRTRHAGHCWKSREELISDILVRTPSHGREKAGRPARTYIQQLWADIGCSLEDLLERWPIEKGGKKRSRRSASVAWHDIYIYIPWIFALKSAPVGVVSDV